MRPPIRSSFARPAFAAALALCPLLAATTASASGFSTARFGGEHGNPMTSNPTSVYYNPGAIAMSQGVNLFLDGTVAFRSVTYDRVPDAGAPGEVPEPADGVGANTGTASLFNVAGAPMLGATAQYDVREDLSLGGGLAFFVPFGGSAVWDKNENFEGNPNYPGPVDGTQRYYTIDGSLRTMYLSAAVSVAYKRFVSLGLSGGLALSSIDSLRARQLSGNTDLNLEGRAWYKGKGTHPQLGAGVLVTPLDDADKLRIGLSYQAQPNFGRLSLNGLLQIYQAGNLSGETPGEDDVELHQSLPDVIRAGVSARPTKEMELRLFGDFTRWSVFDDQCFAQAGEPCEVEENGKPTAGSTVAVNLPRRWNDAFGVRAGMSYWVREPVELFVGVGYDGSAVPDDTLEPSLVDFHDVSTGIGARAQLMDRLGVELSYTQIFYVPRDTTGLSRNPTFDGPSNSPDSGGVYQQSIGVLNVSLHGSFDPFAKEPATAARSASLLGAL